MWSRVLVRSVIPAARYSAQATTWNRISNEVLARSEDDVNDQQDATRSRKVQRRQPNAVSRKYSSWSGMAKALVPLGLV